MPSDSLSQNSSPIVKEMLEQGRLTPNPRNESGNITNGIEHRGKYSNTLRLRHANEIMNEEEGWQEVPEHEIRAAHNLLQDVVHQRKERRGRGAGSRALQREESKPMKGQLSLEFPS
jgi:hypothetical protein